MTEVADRPVTQAAPGPKPSLARAEVRRLSSRRLVRVLVLLGLLGFVLAVGLASATSFGKTTPERLAAAERNIAQVVAQQEVFRQQCLAQVPTGTPPEDFCGPTASAEQFRTTDFLDKVPFELVEALPAGAVAVGAATAALAFVLGATSIGAEWSSRSMVALLFWESRRGRVMAAKIGVLSAAAALLAVVAQLLWAGSAYVMAVTLGSTGPRPAGFVGAVVAQQGRAVVLVVLAALLGFAVSNLARGTGAALGAGFVYFAVVETAVRGVRPGLQRYLLTDNAAALMLDGGHRIFVFGGGFVDERGQFIEGPREIVLSNLHGGLVLGLVSAALVGLGVLVFARRDLT